MEVTMLSPSALDSELGLETILPIQFDYLWRARTGTTPERRLLLAIIEQAAVDVRLFSRRDTTRSRRLYNEACEWVRSGDRSHPLAFVCICETLGLEPSAIRGGILGDGRRHHREAA
jgi:hypothetical protein